VYVKGTDGTPQPVQIVTGDSNGTMTEVIGGNLKPGADVITGQLAGENDAAPTRGRAGGAGAR